MRQSGHFSEISGMGLARCCCGSFNGWKGCFAVCSKLCKWGLWGHRWLAQTEQLWVLDSVPGQLSRENSDGEVEKVLETLQSLPSTVPSRKWLVDHMLQLGFSISLSQCIGSNLKTSGNEVTWTFNLEEAVQMFHSYGEMDYWPLLESTLKAMEIAIVRAEKKT